MFHASSLNINRTRLSWLFGICASLSLISSLATADTDLMDSDQVIVTASRSSDSVDRLPVNTTIITAEDISESSAQTLDQLLRNVPGFNFTGIPAALSDPTGTQTKIRGLGNSKVLVLIDGVPAHDPFYLTTQWFKVPLSQIDHIEVMRGGASSLWGSMAVGGVVNIITKKVANNEGSLEVSTGSQNSQSAGITKNFAVDQTLLISASADYYKTDGYNTTPEEYRYLYPGKGPTRDQSFNARVGIFYTPTIDTQYFLKIGQHQQDQDISYPEAVGRNYQHGPDVSVGFNHAFSSSANINATGWRQSIDFEKLNGSGCYEVSATSCVNSAAKILATPTMSTNPVFDYFSQKGVQSYSDTGGAIMYSYLLNNKGDGVQVGADYRRLEVNDQEYFYSAPSTTLTTPLVSHGDNSGGQQFAGAYAQVKYSPISHLQVTASGRYDSWTTTSLQSLLVPSNGSAFGGIEPDYSKHQFNPSFGVNYQFTNKLTWRASEYSAFRAPGLNNELRSYGFGASSSSTSVANPNLSPETSRGWETGLDYKNNGLKLDLTYFHTALSNMIATYKLSTIVGAPPAVLALCTNNKLGGVGSNCSSSTTFYSNDQNGIASGIEVGAMYQIATGAKLSASYAHTDSYLTATWNGVTTPLNQQLAGVAKETARMDFDYQINRAISARFGGFYTGPLTYAQGTSTAAPAIQGGFTVWDTELNYRTQAGQVIYIKINNLANKVYQDGTYTAGSPYTQSLSMPFSLMVGVHGKF
jgi:outer membrane receptor for ferrienterochelin and colicin